MNTMTSKLPGFFLINGSIIGVREWQGTRTLKKYQMIIPQGASLAEDSHPGETRALTITTKPLFFKSDCDVVSRHNNAVHVYEWA
jgi:hypothetical protein